jgi:predicted amidohydrolase
MAEASLTLALVRDVFCSPDAGERLRDCLREARARGAELALLPELPLHAWVPATQSSRTEDGEAAGGPRERILARAAAGSGIGVVGGAIQRDDSGRRFNTALVFDRAGRCLTRYQKLHLPEEEGFWETRHYEPGAAPPEVVSAFGLPLGVVLCSDVNRPELAHNLAALGALAILAPRATEAATFDRWRLVLRSTALTSASFVASVPRPGPEAGVALGGPSIVLSPDGEVVLETLDPLAIVSLERAAVEEARRRYPGYLAQRSDVYSAAWARVTPSPLPHSRK